jgi:hypothetical protein
VARPAPRKTPRVPIYGFGFIAGIAHAALADEALAAAGRPTRRSVTVLIT